MILILSLTAGVVGTGIGGALGVLFADKGTRVTGGVLGFAGGVMLGVVCFSMLPESIAEFNTLGHGGIAAALGATIIGMLAIFLINFIVERLGKIGNKRVSHRSERMPSISTILAAGAQTVTAVSGAPAAVRSRELMLAGTVMLIAIALHNLPEGMAIGAAGAARTSMGVLVAIVIAVHNVPEGMAIGAPLAGAGVKPFPAIFLSCLAGAATVLGAVLGLFIGALGAIATGICLSLAGGAMLFVTLFDLFPESVSLLGGKLPSAAICVGVICAAAFVYMF